MISKNNEQSPMVATVGIMMMITLAGKVMGILRDRMQLVYYGTDTVESIAFMQATVLPRVFLDVMFASVFSASFIPVFNKYLETKGKQAAFKLAARFIVAVLSVSAAVTVLAVIFANPIYAFFWGSETHAPEVSSLGIRLLRMMLPIMVISSLAFSLTGVLQSLGQFKIPAAMSVASNGIILLYYFLFIGRFGIYGLAVAFLLGWGAQVLIQIPFLVKHQFFSIGMSDMILTQPIADSNRLKKDWADLREIGGLTLPVMVASWLGPVNLMVNGRAATDFGGEHGFVSLISAYNLYTVITGLFVLSLANVLFPALSKLAARKDFEGYATAVRSSLRALLFLLLPTTFGLMAIATPLVRLVFQGGLFQEASVEFTATALFFFSLGIIGFGMQVILSRACFALNDGRGPLVTAVLAMAVNFVLSFTLAPAMGVAGPALASALAFNLAGVGLFLRISGGMTLWNLNMASDIFKMLALSLAMFMITALCLLLMAGIFTEDTIISRVLMVGVPAGIGAAVYFAGALLLKIPEAKAGLKWVIDRMGRYSA